MDPIPTEDGITTRVDEQGKTIKVERRTTRNETETDKIEVITVITTIDELEETKVITQTITISVDKATGTKTTKKKKSTAIMKKPEREVDGITEYKDSETGALGTREQVTTRTETKDDQITVVKVILTTTIMGENSDKEKVVTHTTTTTKNKATGISSVQRDSYTTIRTKRSLYCTFCDH
eukprot:TRINITY_DN11312_c0_g1_i5.p1 TRINITY_DN11312_c0_g1~~TRINITY_DN11312_c0_g1_i5.p1  ORF type:complete len:180 (-),score=32.90 TRINITY_DN11312_c0_g1_i5:1157-1696(-)